MTRDEPTDSERYCPMAKVSPAKKAPRHARGGPREHVWECHRCHRSFTQKNQRHACGTGNRREVLRNRPEALVRLYESIEAFAKSLGTIEIVARERYVLLRSVRIFADLVIMADAIRVAVHLGRKQDDPIFFKVASDRKRFTHVAKLHTVKDFRTIEPYLKEAYELSLDRTEKREGRGEGEGDAERPERARVPGAPGAKTILEVERVAEWREWLAAHHATSPGIWLRIPKQGTGKV